MFGATKTHRDPISATANEPVDPEPELRGESSLQTLMDRALAASEHPVELVEAATKWEADGELFFIGKTFRAKACLFGGRVAWINCSMHNEHLGCVLEREIGLAAGILANAMREAKGRHLKLGEWLVESGLVTMPRLRACLKHHLAAHLRALAGATGGYEVAFVRRPHRYDRALTFDLLEIVATSVSHSIGSTFAFADQVALVDLEHHKVLPLGRPPLDDHELLDIARRVESYAHNARAELIGTVFKSDRAMFCAQRLCTHPRVLLVISCRDTAKMGLVVQGAMRLENEI